MSCNPFVPLEAEWVDNFSRKNIVISDKGPTSYRGENDQQKIFNLFRVDGHLINDNNTSKCDYLLVEFNSQNKPCAAINSYYIEFKGSNLIKAVEQVNNSIALLHHYIADSTPHVRIVLTKINEIDLNDRRVLALIDKLKSKRGTFNKATSILKETL